MDYWTTDQGSDSNTTEDTMNHGQSSRSMGGIDATASTTPLGGHAEGAEGKKNMRGGTKSKQVSEVEISAPPNFTVQTVGVSAVNVINLSDRELSDACI